MIVGVHEAGRGGDGIYYRVGHLRNPAGGDYTIQWDSGQWGIKYDMGANPRIAINNHNEVISVHQVPNENLLHYRRGIVSEGTIQFTESMRYDDYATDPSVALLDSGLVLEVHGNRPQGPNRFRRLMSRTGNLSRSDPARVEWADSYENPLAAWDSPAIATNGTHAIEMHTALREDEGGPDELTVDYSVAEIPQLYANGTLTRGSSDKVYVVLNDYRHWIPNADTFDALGYRWDEILWLSDDEVNAVPEGAPFPSAAPLPGPRRFANGTLVRGSTGKVYVLLNDYRHWIPDEKTFEAMGYDWSKVRKFDDAVNTFPERAPFLQLRSRIRFKLQVKAIDGRPRGKEEGRRQNEEVRLPASSSAFGPSALGRLPSPARELL